MENLPLKLTQVAAGRLLPRCVGLFQPAWVSSRQGSGDQRREEGGSERAEAGEIPGSRHNLSLSFILYISIISYLFLALVVKNPPANADVSGVEGSIPG